METLVYPFANFYSAVLSLKLRGGTIVAEAGSSLADSESGPPFYTDSTSRCEFDYYFGLGFGGVLSCSGPITQATAVYAGRSGRVSYNGRYDGHEVEGWFEWALPPTITIDFD